MHLYQYFKKKIKYRVTVDNLFDYFVISDLLKKYNNILKVSWRKIINNKNVINLNNSEQEIKEFLKLYNRFKDLNEMNEEDKENVKQEMEWLQQNLNFDHKVLQRIQGGY